MKILTKIAYLSIFFSLSQASLADCANANQNNIYDPRIPPAGVYDTHYSDGSSQQVYTTGEKKPYITNNTCSNDQQTASPQVYIKPPKAKSKQ